MTNMKRPIHHAGLCALLFVTAAAMTFSCSPDKEASPSEQDNPDRLSYTCSAANLSPVDAEKEAISIMCTLKSGSLRGIDAIKAEVTPLYGCQPSALRSAEEADTPLAYLVNFKDNNGFAILSANRNCPPILAIHPHGNLDPEKAPDNPTLQMLMERVEEYCLASNEHSETVPDPMHPYNPDGTPIAELHKVEFGPWEEIISERREALIPVVWGQSEAPYNSNLCKRYGYSVHAGCATAAVAQIAAFHRYPKMVDGYQLDWDIMLMHHSLDAPNIENEEAYPYISKLYEVIGDKLGVKYSAKSSGAAKENIRPTLVELGFRSVGDLEDYEYEKIKKEMEADDQSGYPVLICAYAYKTPNKKHFLWWKWEGRPKYDEGHAFVLDGVTKMRRKVSYYTKYDMPEDKWTLLRSAYEYIHLVRANLGWDSNYINGYYHESIFDTNSGPQLRVTDSREGEDHCFQYNMQIIKGIRVK